MYVYLNMENDTKSSKLTICAVTYYIIGNGLY